MTIEIPMELPSVANQRLHWRAKAAQVKAQRKVVQNYWGFGEYLVKIAGPMGTAYRPPPAPWRVTLTRVSPRKLDSDNLASAFKAVRDQIAKHLGVDDGDESRITWLYAQEKGRSSVRIEVTSR